MVKNAVKIREGIKALVRQPMVAISGKVVSGSVDEANGTVSVMPSNGGKAIDGVLLSPVFGNADGLLLYPADGSDVVIIGVDGGGEWLLAGASVITKAKISIGNIAFVMDNTGVAVQSANLLFNVGADLFKMNSASESLYQLLHDLVTYITVLTVPTSGGASGVPVNVLDFSNLLVRLGNLLGT